MADVEPAREVTAGGAELRLVGVTKCFPLGGGEVLPAVDDVSLTVPPGSVVAVTGSSGSGKSTLLHLVGAIERCDAGTIEVDGLDITRLPRRRLAAYRRGVGFVFQRYHLLPALTALDNVLAPVLPYRTTYDRTARAHDLLGAVGLGDRSDALPSRLSGGQQQRVGIARALVARPRLLLADEPTGNLDSRTGAEVLDLLLRLRAEHQMTVLLATHDAAIAARCDRVVRLVDGRVIDDVNLHDGDPVEQTRARIDRLHT